MTKFQHIAAVVVPHDPVDVKLRVMLRVPVWYR